QPRNRARNAQLKGLRNPRQRRQKSTDRPRGDSDPIDKGHQADSRRRKKAIRSRKYVTSIFCLATGLASDSSASMKQHSHFILMAAIVCTMACSVIPSASGGPERMSSKEMASAPVVEQPFSWTGFYIGGNI